MTNSTVSTPAVSERFTGRVKWFNNKAGYGFITVTDGSKSGSDVFVHHSSIRVYSEQYKYLVQGEYIEFCLSDTGGVGVHKYQAGDVSGINGGSLMCETRYESRVARSQYMPTPQRDEDSKEVKMPSSQRPPSYQRPPRSQRPPIDRGERNEWTYVAKTQKSPATTPNQKMNRSPTSSGHVSGSA